MSSVQQIVPPASSPVSYAEAKAHLMLIDDSARADVMRYIQAATAAVEADSRHALMPSTWTLTRDTLPTGDSSILVPIIPLLGVESIAYYNTAGEPSLIEGSALRLSTSALPGTIAPGLGAPLRGSWPGCRALKDSVVITFTAGYENVERVPRHAKQAILLLLTHFYEQRKPVETGTISTELQKSYGYLLDLFRMRGVH